MKAAKKSIIEFFYIEDESPYIEVQVPESLEYLKALEKTVPESELILSFLKTAKVWQIIVKGGF